LTEVAAVGAGEGDAAAVDAKGANEVVEEETVNFRGREEKDVRAVSVFWSRNCQFQV
jgi:hypothetical protein